MKPRLDIAGVSKAFGAAAAVRNLSLSIAPGEFLSLLGPSGCGKSTTLAMVAGFLEPDAGSISIDGKLVNGIPPEKRRIGLVFQDYAVFSRLTVRDNLLFGLEAQRVPRALRMPRIEPIATLLDLAGIMKKRGSSLNMSEMQRVALGRTLATEPKLLLLDEPMSNLDAAIRASLRGELRRIQRKLRQSVLYVTHDQVEAMAMSDRIAVMRDGSILQIGTPDDIYYRPANRFVAEFIGDPPINILDCDIVQTGGRLAANTAAQSAIELGRGSLPEARCLLAVRPHDVSLIRTPGADKGVVSLVEHFGADNVAHIAVGSELITVMTAHNEVQVGDRVGLRIKGENAHIIDAKTGNILNIEREAMVA